MELLLCFLPNIAVVAVAVFGAGGKRSDIKILYISQYFLPLCSQPQTREKDEERRSEAKGL